MNTFRFRQIAAAEAEAEQEIIKAIEKEFAAMEISVVQATTSIAMEPPPPPQPDTTSDDIVEDPSDKLDRLNLMFDNENVRFLLIRGDEEYG